MPVFGIAAPEEAELFKAAADFCRRNGLRFMELRAGMPEGVPVPEGLELLPGARLCPSPRARRRRGRLFWRAWTPGSRCCFPRGGRRAAGAELLGQLLAQPAQRRRGNCGRSWMKTAAPRGSSSPAAGSCRRANTIWWSMSG